MNGAINDCPSWRNNNDSAGEVVNSQSGFNWAVTGDQTVADNCSYVYQPWYGYTYWWPQYESRKTQAFHIAMALDKEGLVRSDTKKGFIDLVVAIERML